MRLHLIMLLLLTLGSGDVTQTASACVAPFRIGEQRTRQPILYVFTVQNHPACRKFWHDYLHGPTEFRRTLDLHYRVVSADARHLQKFSVLPVFVDERGSGRITNYSSWQTLLEQLKIPVPLSPRVPQPDPQPDPQPSMQPEKTPADEIPNPEIVAEASPSTIHMQIRRTLFQVIAAKVTAWLPIGIGSAELLTAGAFGGPVGLGLYFGLRGLWRLLRRKRNAVYNAVYPSSTAKKPTCKNCEQLTALLDAERAEWQRLGMNHEATIDDLTGRLSKSEQARVAGEQLNTRVEYIRVPVMDKEGQLYREAMRREIDALPQSSEIVMRIEKTFRELLRGQRIATRTDKTAVTTGELQGELQKDNKSS